MKKFLMFVAFAAMCVTANAQEVKMTSYADEDMVFQYPADWKPTENTREDVAFEGKDGVSMVEVSARYGEFDADGVKEWAAEKKERKAIWSLKGGDVVTNGNINTIRFTGVKETYDSVKGLVKQNIVCISFAVISNGNSLAGDITYLQKDEAKMKPVVEKMLASMKAQSED